MDKRPKILYVEDDDSVFNAIKRQFDGRVELLRGATLEEGEKLFWENQMTLDLVIMDGCINSTAPNTMPLIRKIAKTGFKPIIACSSHPCYNRFLIDAGCTDEIEKSEIVDYTLNLFNIK